MRSMSSEVITQESAAIRALRAEQAALESHLNRCKNEAALIPRLRKHITNLKEAIATLQAAEDK